MNAVQNLVKIENKKYFHEDTGIIVRKIVEDCRICKKLSSAPRRFKLIVGSDDLSRSAGLFGLLRSRKTGRGPEKN